jgi:hypothetical protein
MKPAPGTKIVEFAEMLGYPDVQKFMALNSDKVKTTEAGVPYVDVNTDYPDYSEIGRAPASTEPASANTLNLDGVTAAASAPMPDNSTQGGSENLAINLLDGLNPDLKIVANPGAEVSTNPKVDLQADFMFTDKKPTVEAPDGMEKVTETQTQTTKSDFDFTKTEDLLSQRQKIDQELSALDLDKSQQESTAALEAMQKIREQEEQFDIAREERQRLQRQRETELMAQVNTVSEEYNAMTVDPDRFFTKRGTGAKILAGIAAGLGAYAASMTGTKNFALEIINKAIDDDIEAQKAEIAKTAGSITEQRNLLNDMIRKGMNDAEAESATRAIMLQRARQMLEERMAKITKEDAKQRGGILQQQIRNDELMKLEQLKQSAASTTTTLTKEEMKPSLQTTLAITREKEKAKAEGKSEGEKKAGLTAKEERELSVPGYLGVAPTPTEGRQARAAVSDGKALMGLLDDLIEQREKYGLALTSPTARTLGQGLAKEAQLIFKGDAFAALGVLAGPDMDIINAVIPEDPAAFKYGVKEQYQAVKERVQRRLNLKLEAMNLTPMTGIGTDMMKSDIREQTKSSLDTYGG